MPPIITSALRRLTSRTVAPGPGTAHSGQGTAPLLSTRRARPDGLGACPPSPVPRPLQRRGFTLIELIVVVAIIGILATIAVPAMRTAPIRARESALKEDLFTLRSCIDQFNADRGRLPSSIDEMVSMGYLRSVPVDPITQSRETWVVMYAEVSEDNADERSEEAGQGIIDVRSGADGVALDGSRYADW